MKKQNDFDKLRSHSVYYTHTYHPLCPYKLARDTLPLFPHFLSKIVISCIRIFKSFGQLKPPHKLICSLEVGLLVL